MVKTSIASLIALARQHAEAEARGDMDALMATMEGEPFYEFFPLGGGFKGMASTCRFYEHFFSDFRKRIAGHELKSEAVGPYGVISASVITLTHAADAEPTRHLVMAILVFGKRGIAGERMFSDETLFRAMLGPLWDELEPIQGCDAWISRRIGNRRRAN